MYLAQLSFPTAPPNATPTDHKLGALLTLLEDSVADANIAYLMFLDARRSAPMPAAAALSAGTQQQTEVARLMRERLATLNLNPSSADEETLETARVWASGEEKRLRWATTGVSPNKYVSRIQLLHARAYVYALDTLSKTLCVMSDAPFSVAAAGRAVDELNTAMPDLRKVRDSFHHLEDRLRGLGKWGKPFKVGPQGIWWDGVEFEDDHVRGQRGALVCTTADGALGKVEISEEKLVEIVRSVQAAIDDLPWNGRRTWSPKW